MHAEKSKAWLALTIVVGLITTLLVFNYLKNVKTVKAAEPMTTVVVAAQKIPEGTRLTEKMLKTSELPQKYAVNAIHTLDQAINKVTTAALMPEEVLLKDQLASPDTASELPYKIPEGSRAITIGVTPTSGVAGLIKPGHFVDVLLTYKVAEEYKTVTLLQKTLVLAVGADLKKKEAVQAAENVTLAVKPDDAELITFSETIGKLNLVLRPAAEGKTNSLKPVDLAKLQSLYP